MAKNKQNFDLQNLHELNAPIKLGIGALLILAILGLGYFLLFKDQLAEYDAAKAKEVELKESYANKSVQAASLENLRNSKFDSGIEPGRINKQFALGCFVSARAC